MKEYVPINLRPFSKPLDFDDLNEFAKEQTWKNSDGGSVKGFDPLILPTIGVCIYRGDKKLCFGFLYLESSCVVAHVEWIVTNPENTPRESLQSIGLAIDYLVGCAKKLGYQFIFTASNNKNLIRMYEKSGFKQTDKQMVHLVYQGD